MQKRIRFRLSTRAAILLLTLIAILLGTWVERSNRQRNAVRQIERLGGTAFYGETNSFVVTIPFVTDLLDPDMVASAEEVQFTSFRGMVTDVEEIIPFLKRLPCLRRVLLFPHQEGMIPRLHRALPAVEVEIIRSGVPLVG